MSGGAAKTAADAGKPKGSKAAKKIPKAGDDASAKAKPAADKPTPTATEPKAAPASGTLMPPPTPSAVAAPRAGADGVFTGLIR